MSQSMYLHRVTRIVFDKCEPCPLGGAVRHFNIYFGDKQKLEFSVFSASNDDEAGWRELQVTELTEGTL